MQIQKIVTSPLDTNCYIISKDNACIIFDCGGTDEILKYLQNYKLNPKIIFLTHGHYDHISALQNIRNYFTDISVIAYEKEREVLEDADKNLSHSMFDDNFIVNNINYKKDNETINTLDMNIKLIATAGHTVGGCCYYIEKEKILFSGDTLFYNTYGRYDLPTSSLKDLIDSVGNKLMKLDDDVIVYPGHGMITNIGNERKNNELCWDYVVNYGKNL